MWRNDLTTEDRIHTGHPQYPELLLQIQNPPEYLYRLGVFPEREPPAVALVGSRHANPYGFHMARILGGGLAARGVTVVSGLARGIDTAAHTAALEKNGRTIAVIGCGLDVDYPRGSSELRRRISENGAVLSEFEQGTPPFPGNFPARNRIISGLSLAVVVVQAGLKSGSLITARWALDQGREVMAVPGRADDPLSAGPVALLRDGAAPACSADDILDTLGLEVMAGPPPGAGNGGHEDNTLLAALSPGPRLPEDLAASTGWPLPRILSELSGLELEGLIYREPGGRFALK